MTPADLEQIANYGIRCAYDLRSNSERRDQPSSLNGLKEALRVSDGALERIRQNLLD
jgi:hypothetical protein